MQFKNHYICVKFLNGDILSKSQIINLNRLGVGVVKKYLSGLNELIINLTTMFGGQPLQSKWIC